RLLMRSSSEVMRTLSSWTSKAIRSIFSSIRRSMTKTMLSGSSAMAPLLRRDRGHGAVGRRRPGVGVDALFDHVAEIADQALHRPRRGVAQRADGVALDL